VILVAFGNWLEPCKRGQPVFSAYLSDTYRIDPNKEISMKLLRWSLGCLLTAALVIGAAGCGGEEKSTGSKVPGGKPSQPAKENQKTGNTDP
jgi:hypothetical protein